MDHTDDENQVFEQASAPNTKPKKPHEDQSAYLLISAGIASYVETGDVRYLISSVVLYVAMYFMLRINAQIQESNRAVKKTANVSHHTTNLYGHAESKVGE